MGMHVEVEGTDRWDGYRETLRIEEDEDDSNKVVLTLSDKAKFDKKELLRAVRIMCEE
jgi:acetone carboxylase gamma subunit